nr:MAG TPA: hypothetical protein [Bacteriophage sp.]
MNMNIPCLWHDLMFFSLYEQSVAFFSNNIYIVYSQNDLS